MGDDSKTQENLRDKIEETQKIYKQLIGSLDDEFSPACLMAAALELIVQASSFDVTVDIRKTKQYINDRLNELLEDNLNERL